MKWKSPKAFAAILLTSMMLVAGCGSNGNNAANNGNAGNAGNTGNAGTNAEATADTSPITFTFFGADASPNWNNMQDEVGKVITEKTGVTIEAEFDVGAAAARTKSP